MKNPKAEAFGFLAGMARFELTNAGVKVPCLTAWRHPNNFYLYIIANIIRGVKCFCIFKFKNKYPQEKHIDII